MIKNYVRRYGIDLSASQIDHIIANEIIYNDITCAIEFSDNNQLDRLLEIGLNNEQILLILGYSKLKSLFI